MPPTRFHLSHLLAVLALVLGQLPRPWFQAGQTAPAAASGAVGYLSIPAADFRPTEPGSSYENHARYLIHLDGDESQGYYVAPVLLPQGATVTRFTLAFRDNATSDLIATLYRDDSSGMGSQMVQLDSSGSYPMPWYGSKVDISISLAVIDNASYAYYLNLQMPESVPGSVGPLVWFCGATIEYVLPAAPVNPGIYSMPVAGFTAFQDGYTYLNTGRYLYHNSGPGGDTSSNGWYFARLTLPHGATISSLKVFYSINSSYGGYARLQRTRLGYGDYSDLALISIPAGTQGDYSLTTTAITNGLVDNTQYAYWLTLDLPPLDRPNSTIIPYYLVVQYTGATESQGPRSIPAAAFTFYEEGYDYQNDARYLSHYHDPAGGNGRGWYLAPVQLPQGVQVTYFTFYYYDSSGSYSGIAILQRTDLAGQLEEMTCLTSEGWPVSGHFGASISSVITHAVIDNRYHAYWVVFDLPAASLADIRGCGVVIEYKYPLYLPRLNKPSQPAAAQFAPAVPDGG